MATHSSVLAYRVLWTEEPGGLLSMGSHRVGHDWSDLACMHALEKEMTTHSSVLAWRIPGTEESGGLPSMGLHRVRHNWSDLAAAAATKPPPLASFCQSNHSCIELSIPGTHFCSLFLVCARAHTHIHTHTHTHTHVVLAQVASSAYHRPGSLKTEITFLTVWRLEVQAQVSAVWASSESSLSAHRWGLS